MIVLNADPLEQFHGISIHKENAEEIRTMLKGRRFRHDCQNYSMDWTAASGGDLGNDRSHRPLKTSNSPMFHLFSHPASQRSGSNRGFFYILYCERKDVELIYSLSPKFVPDSESLERSAPEKRAEVDR